MDGAIEVPIYIPETRWSPINVLKQLSNFGLGGWWLGGSHMIPNQTFMQDVRDKVPQDAKVIVACQKGLRWALMSWGYKVPKRITSLDCTWLATSPL